MAAPGRNGWTRRPPPSRGWLAAERGSAMNPTLHDHMAATAATDHHVQGNTSSGTARAGDEGHAPHAGHGHGDHVAMFRRRFWWSLLLTVPIVATSQMVMDWFGYNLDFWGIEWVGP